MSALVPFGPASGLHMGDLEIETDEDRLTLSGSIVFDADREGLERLERLSTVLKDAVRALRSRELPDEMPAIAPGPIGPNPFEE